MLWTPEARKAITPVPARSVLGRPVSPVNGGAKPAIILQGKALKVVNKGGGKKCKTINLGGGRRQMQFSPKTKGTDYIIFNCTGCGARNKGSAYKVIGSAGESVSIKCNRCYREIEVARPTSTPILIDPNSPAQSPMGLVGPDGRPISR